MKKIRIHIWIICLLAWAQLSKSVLFKRLMATTDFLDEVTVLSEVTSRIHCASSCWKATNEDDCAAFHFDRLTNVCSCGRRLNFEKRSTGSVLRLHSNILCKIPSQPGKLMVYLWQKTCVVIPFFYLPSIWLPHDQCRQDYDYRQWLSLKRANSTAFRTYINKLSNARSHGPGKSLAWCRKREWKPGLLWWKQCP